MLTLASDYSGRAGDLISMRNRLDAIVARAGIRQAGQTSFDVYAAQREAEAQTAPLYAQIREAFRAMGQIFYTEAGFGGPMACYHAAVTRLDGLLARVPAPAPSPTPAADGIPSTPPSPAP